MQVVTDYGGRKWIHMTYAGDERVIPFEQRFLRYGIVKMVDAADLIAVLPPDPADGRPNVDTISGAVEDWDLVRQVKEAFDYDYGLPD